MCIFHMKVLGFQIRFKSYFSLFNLLNYESLTTKCLNLLNKNNKLTSQELSVTFICKENSEYQIIPQYYNDKG